MQKRTFFVFAATALAVLVAYGCSGDDEGTPATADAGPDAPPKKTADVSETIDSGPCKPESAASFEPNWLPPLGFGQGLCSDQQIEDIITCSFDDTADQTFCDAVYANTDNEPCGLCIFTEPTVNTGPLTISGNSAGINVAGCIANVQGDLTDQGCGAKVQAADDCAAAVCDCFTGDEAGVETHDQCLVEARTSSCETYATAAKCSEPLVAAGGAAEKCNADDDFMVAAKHFSKLFCGAGAGDGGTDAAADSPVDG